MTNTRTADTINDGRIVGRAIHGDLSKKDVDFCVGAAPFLEDCPDIDNRFDIGTMREFWESIDGVIDLEQEAIDRVIERENFNDFTVGVILGIADAAND